MEDTKKKASQEPKDSFLDKKQLIIAASVVGVILLAVVVWQFIDFGVVSTPAPEPQTEEETRQIITEAVSGLDKSICDQINDDMERSDCVEQVITSQAMTGDDASLCNDLESEAKIVECEDRVVISKAVRSKDVSYCSDVSTEIVQDKCERIVGSVIEASAE